MSRRRWWIAAGAALVALVVVVAVYLALRRPRPQVPGAVEAPPAAGAVRLAAPVDLYFPAAGGRLAAERREIELPEDPREQVRLIVEALLAGPQGEGLYAPLPSGVALTAVYLGADGVAYVDLRGVDGGEPPAAGSTLEMQMVYSLVDSVALNVPRVSRVVVLWNGSQRETFAGHLDTSRPLPPDTALVSRR